jgi:hypothetical protein
MEKRGFIENIQALIIVTGNLASYPLKRDRNVIYMDASLTIESNLCLHLKHGFQ